jgi:hypothetical protein
LLINVGIKKKRVEYVLQTARGTRARRLSNYVWGSWRDGNNARKHPRWASAGWGRL